MMGLRDLRRIAWLLLASCGMSLGGAAHAEPAGGSRWAVSLRVLQQRLSECRGSFARCPEPLATLGGLSWLDGYLVAEEGREIILYGKRVPGEPSLSTEDFAVALRNAWYLYAEQRGNTLYYSTPGCSIDPDPTVVAELQRIGRGILGASTPEAIEVAIERWRSKCSAPQQVSILGVPSSRFARIMVEADYLMKRIVDGSQEAGVEGFLGLPARATQALLQEASGGSIPQMTFSPVNRFEFFPGEVVFGVDNNGIVQIERCPVTILTEAEYLSRSGRLTGSGQADPRAQALAEEFTARYREIAARHPVYRELEGLFRFVAVASLMRKQVDRPLVAPLLDGPAVMGADISATKPGLSSVTRISRSSPTADGETILQLWVPTCGGVNIDIERAGLRELPRSLDSIRAAALAARLDRAALGWAF